MKRSAVILDVLSGICAASAQNFQVALALGGLRRKRRLTVMAREKDGAGQRLIEI
jgi:hypothetical protein